MKLPVDAIGPQDAEEATLAPLQLVIVQHLRLGCSCLHYSSITAATIITFDIMYYCILFLNDRCRLKMLKHAEIAFPQKPQLAISS